MTKRNDTVDGLITIAGREIILIERTKPPFEDKLVLPGGHIEDGESEKAACVRELEEEIGLTVCEDDLELLIVINNPGRDPRPGHDKTTVFHVDLPDRSALKTLKAGSDAKSIVVRELVSLEPSEIGFDHFEAIALVR